MMKLKYLFSVIFCLFFISCAPLIIFGIGTATGIVGYQWYQGALTVVYQAPYMETWEASLKVLNDMNFRIESKEHDLTTGKIEAMRSDKKAVTVSLKYVSSRETEAIIRVGIFGDKNASEAIKEEIRKELFK